MATRSIYLGKPVTVLPPAARIGNPTVDTFEVIAGKGAPTASGLILVIDVTAVDLTSSVVFTVQGVDEVSGKTWDILASAAITAVGTTILQVHPNLTAAANSKADDLVPSRFTITAVHADASSVTYSVSADLT